MFPVGAFWFRTKPETRRLDGLAITPKDIRFSHPPDGRHVYPHAFSFVRSAELIENRLVVHRYEHRHVPFLHPCGAVHILPGRPTDGRIRARIVRFRKPFSKPAHQVRLTPRHVIHGPDYLGFDALAAFCVILVEPIRQTLPKSGWAQARSAAHFQRLSQAGIKKGTDPFFCIYENRLPVHNSHIRMDTLSFK
jgi:hypothetical protein